MSERASDYYEAFSAKRAREIDAMREDFVGGFRAAYDEGGHDALLHEVEAAIRRACWTYEGAASTWEVGALAQAIHSLQLWPALGSKEWGGLLDEVQIAAFDLFFDPELGDFADTQGEYDDFIGASGPAGGCVDMRLDSRDLVAINEDTVDYLRREAEGFAVPGQAGEVTEMIYTTMSADLAWASAEAEEGEDDEAMPEPDPLLHRDAWEGLLESCERRALDLFDGEELREDYLRTCGHAEGHVRLLLAVDGAARGFEEAAEDGGPGVGRWARRAYDCDVDGMEFVVNPHRPRLVLDAREGEIVGTSPHPGWMDDSVEVGLSEEAAAAARKWMDDRRAPSVFGAPAPDDGDSFELWAAPCDDRGRPEGREVQKNFEPSVGLDARLNLDAHGTYRGREWFILEAEDCDDIMGADGPRRCEGVGADYIPHIIDAAPRRGDLLAVERVERDELGRGPRPADREEAVEAARAGFEEACDAPCDLARREWDVYAACSSIYAHDAEGWGMRCEFSASDLAHSAHMWGDGAEELAMESLGMLIRWGLISATVMEDGTITMWAAPAAGPTSWRAKDGDELREVEEYALAGLAGEDGAVTDYDRKEAASIAQTLDMHRLPPTSSQIGRAAKMMEWLWMPELVQRWEDEDEEEGS